MREECQDFILRTHFVAALLSSGVNILPLNDFWGNIFLYKMFLFIFFLIQ